MGRSTGTPTTRLMALLTAMAGGTISRGTVITGTMSMVGTTGHAGKVAMAAMAVDAARVIGAEMTVTVLG